VKAPFFIQSVFGILGGIGPHPEAVERAGCRAQTDADRDTGVSAISSSCRHVICASDRQKWFGKLTESRRAKNRQRRPKDVREQPQHEEVVYLFDYLVGAVEERRGNRGAKRLCSFVARLYWVVACTSRPRGYGRRKALARRYWDEPGNIASPGHARLSSATVTNTGYGSPAAAVSRTRSSWDDVRLVITDQKTDVTAGPAGCFGSAPISRSGSTAPIAILRPAQTRSPGVH